MTELEYVIKHGGLTPKRLLKKITRRGFGASVLSGLAGAAASRLIEHTRGCRRRALISRLPLFPILSIWLNRALTIPVDITLP